MSTHALDALSRLLFTALLLLLVCTIVHASVVPLTDEQLREYELFANDAYAYEQRFPAAKRELKGKPDARIALGPELACAGISI